MAYDRDREDCCCYSDAVGNCISTVPCIHNTFAHKHWCTVGKHWWLVEYTSWSTPCPCGVQEGSASVCSVHYQSKIQEDC